MQIIEYKRAMQTIGGDKVFLEISPMKDVMRFGKKGNFRPRFVGPFEIAKQVRKLAYRVALLPDLAGINDVFDVSMWRKFIPNRDIMFEYQLLEIQEAQTYKEMPLRIMDRIELVLRTNRIPIVKVLRYNHGVEDASCEVEQDMKIHYPQLFKEA